MNFAVNKVDVMPIKEKDLIIGRRGTTASGEMGMASSHPFFCLMWCVLRNTLKQQGFFLSVAVGYWKKLFVVMVGVTWCYFRELISSLCVSCSMGGLIL